MAKTKKVETEVPESPNARVEKDRVQVFNAGGIFVREYSLETHGKDFVDKAKEYAGKVKGAYRFPILT